MSQSDNFNPGYQDLLAFAAQKFQFTHNGITYETMKECLPSSLVNNGEFLGDVLLFDIFGEPIKIGWLTIAHESCTPVYARANIVINGGEPRISSLTIIEPPRERVALVVAKRVIT